MKRPVTLLLGALQSQHLGLSEMERDAIYQQYYKPLLKTLYNYADVRFWLYFSGIVYEWLNKHHSEFVDVLGEMTKRKQIELVGGGFYEPIFPLIPKADRLGQIERLTALIRKEFGRRPRGAWLASGVWDQRIASSLSSGGIEYTFLDGERIGLELRHQSRPFLTEDQGRVLSVFPITPPVRRTLFREKPEDVIKAIERCARAADKVCDDEPVVTLCFEGDDVAPDYEAAIEWLTEFFDTLATQADWIRLDIPARVHRRTVPTLRYTPPTTRFSDLWAWHDGEVPAVRERSVSLSLSYRSILEYYPEAARLYAKMQYTHVLVNQVRGDKYRKMTAREELWRGQSNYAYWHNQTGGIYRSELRKATYAALLEAEKATREKGVFLPSILRLDFDLDGHDEVLYQGNDINAYVHLHGGYLFELDHLGTPWNYLDTFARRPEPYHDQSAERTGYDSWPRGAFVDHLLATKTTQAQFAAAAPERICDMPSLHYRVESLDKEHHRATLGATCDVELAALVIRKRYSFSKGKIEVAYTIRNDGLETIKALFGTEVNLSFFGIDPGSLRVNVRQGRQRQELAPDSIDVESVSDIQFVDRHNAVSVTVAPAGRPAIWSFPVHAQALLAGGPAWLYQFTSNLFRWPLELEAGGEFETAVTLRFESIR